MMDTTSPSDLALLDAWRAGDRAAGEMLFQRHYDSVARFFHNKVSEPNELIQRTFLTCIESPSRFRGESSFRTFLFGVASMLLRNHYRACVGPRKHEVLETASVRDQRHSPSQLIMLDEEERLVLAALRMLPLDDQILLELRFWERLKQRELAEVLETTQATIKNHLRKSMALLRQNVTKLSTSSEKLHSTLTRLDGWAKQIRDAIPREKTNALR